MATLKTAPDTKKINQDIRDKYGPHDEYRVQELCDTRNSQECKDRILFLKNRHARTFGAKKVKGQKEGRQLPGYVLTHIYVIRCIHPDRAGKPYVGQTRTHVHNNKKYREFGVLKRWRQHVHEANCFSEKSTNQSRLLNADIKQYRAKDFEIEVLRVCPVRLGDHFETLYIEKLDSARTGYNITAGGTGGPSSLAARHAVATSLEVRNDERRIAKYDKVDVAQVTMGRFQAVGVQLYIIDTRGRKTHTQIYGRHATLEQSVRRAKHIARTIVRGNFTKIIIAPSLNGAVVFD